MICLFGELAAHVFVPGSAAATAVSQPVQLGGGVGMMTRYLVQAGERPRLVAISGGDSVGKMIRAGVPYEAHAEHYVDGSARTSTVFLLHGETGVSDVRIEPGMVDVSLARPAAARLTRNDIAYVPAFPEHDSLVRAAVGTAARTVVDFGFAPWASSYEMIASRLRQLPAAWLAQISGGELAHENRLRLLDVARDHGYAAVVVTGGADETLGRFADTKFSVPAQPVTPVCTIGCGDVFIAETLRRLTQKESLETACQYGVRAARYKAGQWGIEE